jgi:hypothetical protein
MDAAVAFLSAPQVDRIVAYGQTAVGAEISARSVFDAASLTKQIIARYVLTLATRGELDLDAPIDLPPSVVDAAPDRNDDAGSVLWQHGDNSSYKHIVAVRPDPGDGVIALTNSDSGVTFTREIGARYGVPPERH